MGSTVTKEKAEEMLALHPTLEINDDNIAQFQVMMEAMNIYADREEVRGGLWKRAGAGDSSFHLRSKGERIAFAATHGKHEAALDDAIDAVNYAGFFVRNVRAGRTGPS